MSTRRSLLNRISSTTAAAAAVADDDSTAFDDDDECKYSSSKIEIRNKSTNESEFKLKYIRSY